MGVSCAETGSPEVFSTAAAPETTRLHSRGSRILPLRTTWLEPHWVRSRSLNLLCLLFKCFRIDQNMLPLLLVCPQFNFLPPQSKPVGAAADDHLQDGEQTGNTVVSCWSNLFNKAPGQQCMTDTCTMRRQRSASETYWQQKRFKFFLYLL